MVRFKVKWKIAGHEFDRDSYTYLLGTSLPIVYDGFFADPVSPIWLNLTKERSPNLQSSGDLKPPSNVDYGLSQGPPTKPSIKIISNIIFNSKQIRPWQHQFDYVSNEWWYMHTAPHLQAILIADWASQFQALGKTTPKKVGRKNAAPSILNV